MKIHLVKLCCERDHCIIAAAYNAEHATRRMAEKLMQQRARDLNLPPHCTICLSTSFFYHYCRTTFASMAEAMPILKEAEAENLGQRKQQELESGRQN